MVLANYDLAKEMYLQGKSLTAIQKEIGVERHRLAYMLKQDGVEIRQNGQKHIYNENFFKIIDTEEKAYWLGFLYADGNVVNYGHYEVKISLAYKDLEHVKKFEKVILLNDKDTIVYPYQAKLKGKEYPSAKITVSSKIIVEQLIALGCIPNKSLTLTFPDNKIIPDNLKHHFIRGYFDGDGSVSPVKKTGNVCVSFVGTKLFLQEIYNTFNTICSNYGANTFYQKKGQQAFQISKTKYDTNKEIYQYIYKDATVYLERKYNRFVKLYGDVVGV